MITLRSPGRVAEQKDVEAFMLALAGGFWQQYAPIYI
jgi:hypothetical protein